MRLLKSTIHSDVSDKLDGNGFTRNATRAIVLYGENILLLYTKRYHDYTLPGGGLNDGEDKICGLKRELTEETGAQNISNIQAYGLYEEWYKDEHDYIHMRSYCYTCTIDEQLKAPSLEVHEIQNGMTPKWINIFDAIAHNEQTMAHSDKQGLSIIRETFLLKKIVAELL